MITVLLADAGYDRTDQVEERGQFAVRGGILDVYPATEEQAIRVELFGDEIESMRRFSVFTQRSSAMRSGRARARAELSAEHREKSTPGALSRRSTWCRTRRSS
jgi:transcription-repair coupling factor (superfamily II helicase)